jgi:hypothetical protein
LHGNEYYYWWYIVLKPDDDGTRCNASCCREAEIAFLVTAGSREKFFAPIDICT